MRKTNLQSGSFVAEVGTSIEVTASVKLDNQGGGGGQKYNLRAKLLPEKF
ncbi:MAG: hypothetical protein LBT05_04430 [Planctomycetaceae bacterium]|nr:hypothetical protein [Planctomycetaceae bacterium]